jgi:hypothetical protein
MLLMPFINSDLRDKKGKRICGRDWWDVKETGDYIFDCALGNTLAEAYLRYAKERGDSPSGILSYIVDSMIEKGHDYCRGVRIGFLGRLAQALPEGYYFQESTEGEQIVLVR